MARRLIALAFTLALAACAGTNVRDASGDYRLPAGAKIAQWKLEASQVDTDAGRELLQTGLAKGLADLVDERGEYLVRVDVTTYTVRGGLTRALVGAMAGQDHVVSTVAVFNRAGARLGYFTVESNNPDAWETATSLLEHHAAAIVEQLRGSGS